MNGTSSARTTSASLPSASSTCQQASTEPTASPSGRACDVSTNRSVLSTRSKTACRLPICSSCAGTMPMLDPFVTRPFLSTSFAALVAVAHRVQLLLDHVRAIEVEHEVRRLARLQPQRKLVPDVSLRRLQRQQRLLGFGLGAQHGNINVRRLPFRHELDHVDRDEPNARIGQPALKQRGYLFADGVFETLMMML